MLSQAAEFLHGALYGLHTGLCPTCAAKMMSSTHEEMVMATKELILNGLVLAEDGLCDSCHDLTSVARLRPPGMNPRTF